MRLGLVFLAGLFAGMAVDGWVLMDGRLYYGAFLAAGVCGIFAYLLTPLKPKPRQKVVQGLRGLRIVPEDE